MTDRFDAWVCYDGLGRMRADADSVRVIARSRGEAAQQAAIIMGIEPGRVFVYSLEYPHDILRAIALASGQ